MHLLNYVQLPVYGSKLLSCMILLFFVLCVVQWRRADRTQHACDYFCDN